MDDEVSIDTIKIEFNASVRTSNVQRKERRSTANTRIVKKYLNI